MARSEIGRVASRAAADRAKPVKTDAHHPSTARGYETITNPRRYLGDIEESAAAAAKAAAQDLINHALGRPQGTKPSEPKGLAEAEEPAATRHERGSATADANMLIDAVVSEIQEKKGALDQICASWNELMRGIIARLYLASMTLLRDGSALDQLLEETGVTRSKRGPPTNQHMLVSRAVLRKSGWEPPDGTLGGWVLRLRALQLDEVEEDAARAEHWLKEEVILDARTVSGDRRARAVIKQHRYSPDAQQQRNEQDADDQSAFEDRIRRAAAQPLGCLEPNPSGTMPAGRCVLLVEEGVALLTLPMSEKEIRKRVLCTKGQP